MRKLLFVNHVEWSDDFARNYIAVDFQYWFGVRVSKRNIFIDYSINVELKNGYEYIYFSVFNREIGCSIKYRLCFTTGEFIRC